MAMGAELEISRMTTVEKLQTMEALWEALSRDEKQVPSPAWHGDVLRERERRIEAGEETFIDWDEAKRQLRQRLP